MAPKTTYVANVTLFDGHAVKKRQGVLFGKEGIEWVGRAHAGSEGSDRRA
jgi:hypothetical protein